MKKVLRISLIIIVVLVILVGIFASYIALRSLPKYDVEKIAVKIDYTPERIEKGTKLASMLCRSCHYNSSTQKFTGRELVEAPQFGTIYTKNITHDPVAGIGNWTDGDLVYFIRTGVRPKDGQYVPPYMPKLIHISDEDLYSIIAFLRSDNSWVQADNTRQPETKPSFLTKFLVTIGVIGRFELPKEKIPEPDTTNLVTWGKYIACYQLECFSCHSRDFADNDYYVPEKSPGFFGGGNAVYNLEGQKLKTLNITMDNETGIGTWTEDDFIKAVKSGIVPNGQPALRQANAALQ